MGACIWTLDLQLVDLFGMDWEFWTYWKKCVIGDGLEVSKAYQT